MNEFESLSLEELDEAIRADPDHSSEEIAELLSRVEGPDHRSRVAMMTLNNLAHDYPRCLLQHVDAISSLLYHADDVGHRNHCAEILSELVSKFPEAAEDAKRGLTEATRLRTDRLEDRDAFDEIQTIRRGLEGWKELAEQGHTVPETVAENAVRVLEAADSTTVVSTIQLLREAILTGTPRKDMAIRALYDLASVDDALVRRHATKALAKTYVEGAIEKHPEKLLAVFEQNRDLTDAAVVDEAIERIDGN